MRRHAGKHREDLTGEHGLGDAGQIVLACAFIAVWTADTFFFGLTVSLNKYVPFAARVVIGGVLLALSGYVAKTGLSIVFDEVRETPCVIRKGVFRLVRHPVYLSEILLYLGLLSLSISLAAGAVWVVAIVFLHYISRQEEKLLLARFGEDYSNYMRDVPMWIPRVRRRGNGECRM